jgi:uncharacterized protein (TIGR03435 family)
MHRTTVAAGIVLCAAALSAQSSRFEVVSIKPSSRDLYPSTMEEEDPCSAALPRLTGRQLSSSTTTLYALIALAYNPWKQSGGACAFAARSDLISGGPAWIKSQRHVVQMLFPEGSDTAAYERLLVAGEAPDVQRMLQTMLAERFTLGVRRETKDMPAYFIAVSDTPSTTRRRIAESTSTQPIPERFAPGIYTSYPAGTDGKRYTSITFKRQSMARLAQRLGTIAQRPVFDRTAVPGEFDFILEFDDTGALRPTVFTAMQEQLGLRLQPARAPVDVLVVESAQMPTAN